MSVITAQTQTFTHPNQDIMSRRRHNTGIRPCNDLKGVAVAPGYFTIINTDPAQRVDSMVARLLVAMDGSATGEKAFRKALHLGKELNAELHALYVAPPKNYPLTPPTPAYSRIDPTYDALATIIDKETEHMQHRMESIAEEIGAEIRIHIQTGDARSEIIRLAQQLAADIIVLGSVGRSRLDRLLLGSVSSYVVEHSPISTLIVRP